MARPQLAVQDDDQLLYGDLPTRLKAVAALKAAGIKQVRLNAIYGKTHDASGKADYSALDQAVNGLRQQGIGSQLTLMGDPEYGKSAFGTGAPVNSKLSATNHDPQAMGSFAAEAAAHFKGRVGRYEIGNEPNHPAFLASKHPAKDYRKMLDAGLFGVRSQDSKAQVLMAGLQPSGALPFLRRVVGNKPLAVDGVAIHPYGQRGKSHRSAHNAGIADLGHVQQVLRSLARKGTLTGRNGGKADLYITEDGTQRKGVSDAAHVRESAARYGNAQRAGAKEYTQYQMSPKFAAWDTSLPVGKLAARIARKR